MRALTLTAFLVLTATSAVAQTGRPDAPPRTLTGQRSGAPDQGRGLYGPDTGGDEDRRPELAPSQQGGGQQTGGPARNLIPGDNLHVAPR